MQRVLDTIYHHLNHDSNELHWELLSVLHSTVSPMFQPASWIIKLSFISLIFLCDSSVYITWELNRSSVIWKEKHMWLEKNERNFLLSLEHFHCIYSKCLSQWQLHFSSQQSPKTSPIKKLANKWLVIVLMTYIRVSVTSLTEVCTQYVIKYHTMV